MAGDLVEAFRSASKKHKAGNVGLVCLDDESLPESEYGRMGQHTVVPRAREEGGIMGLPLGNDCKYGNGVTRRRLKDNGEGGFIVEETIENFRPDKAAEELDLFSDEMLEQAGIELQDDEDLSKRAMDMMMDTGVTTPNQPSQGASVAPHQPSEMMQMMQMMLNVMQQNNKPQPTPAPAPAPQPPAKPKPKQPTGKAVVFSGVFGRITVQYASVQFEPEFVVLVSSPDQPTMYEPPVSTTDVLNITVDGKTHPVLHLGLSFSYKGDILLLMPLAANSDHTDDQEE